MNKPLIITIYIIVVLLLLYISNQLIPYINYINKKKISRDIFSLIGVGCVNLLLPRRYKWRKGELGNKPRRTIWMYWEGKSLDWVNLMVEIAEKNSGCEVVLLNPKTIHSIISTNELITDWQSITPIAHKADYLRSVILTKFGGIWLDVDTIVLQDLNYLLDMLEDYDMVGFDQMGFNPNLGVLVCRANSPIMRKWKEELEITFNSTKKIKTWSYNIFLLHRICFDLIVRDGLPYKSIYHNTTYIIPFYKDYLWLSLGNFKSIKRDNQPILTFSGRSKKKFDNMNRDQLINSSMLWSSAVRFALINNIN